MSVRIRLPSGGCSHGSVSRPCPLLTAHRAVATDRIPERVYSSLQPLAANLYVRWRYDSSLWGTRRIGDRINHPLPADTATFVDSQSCAAALPNLHSPIVA